jgi:glycosyltransferase involved in cell wall biosynthesis
VTRLRIAIIAPSDSAVVEPFTGGLTAHVSASTRALCHRGHAVTLFAAPGSDPSLPVVNLDLRRLRLSDVARRDVSMSTESAMAEHHAYLSLMLQLARQADQWDVIHNHSLHYLPIAMARSVAVPMVTTLHTPPTPWLESAIQTGPVPPIRFVAVSEYTAAQWRPLISDVSVIANGVDCARWRFGAGGQALAWSGRLVPEKAPHLAIAAARRAGREIVLAGPIADPRYFAARVQPLLGDDARYAGHLGQAQLSRLIASSGVLVASPVWDEPYGMVVAEALACGTPVAAFRRGGIPEIVDPSCGRLAPPGDVDALADAIWAAEGLDRRDARRRAEQHCSIELMMDGYEALLKQMIPA